MSDIIYTPPVSSGGGVNPTSTYMPVNIGGTFVDSIIQCLPNTFAASMRGASGFGFGTTVSGTSCQSWLGDWNNQIDGIYIEVKNDTISSRIFTANRGFYLDYVINRYIFGDWASVYNKTQLVIDDQNELFYTKNNLVNTGLSIDFNIRQFLFGSYGAGSLTYLSIEDSLGVISTKYQTNTVGLNLDLNSKLYSFGDFNNTLYGTTLIVNDQNKYITTKDGTNEKGLRCDFQAEYYYLGDYNNVTAGTYMQIDNFNSIIETKFQGQSIGLSCDRSAGTINCFLGDYVGYNNTTFIQVDDGTQNITFNLASNLIFNGAAIQSNSAGGNSGEHLVITLNGNQYKIKLENP
jgi:hypothetical protein